MLVKQRKEMVEDLARLSSQRAAPGTPSLVGRDVHGLLADLRSTEDKLLFAKGYYEQTSVAYAEMRSRFPNTLVVACLAVRERPIPAVEDLREESSEPLGPSSLADMLISGLRPTLTEAKPSVSEAE